MMRNRIIKFNSTLHKIKVKSKIALMASFILHKSKVKIQSSMYFPTYI